MNQSVPVDQRWQSSSAQLKLRALRASLLRRRRALTIVALALSVAPLSAAAATVPVVACRLQTMAGLRSVSAPSSVGADIGRQWKGQIAYYTIGNLAVFAPAGWHCVGHSGTEGSELRVVPDASDLTRTDLHGHVGVVAALLAGYGGHYMDVLATGAPFFANLRAIAAKEGTRAQPIAGEHLTYVSATQTMFCDPAQIRGTGGGSGGSYPSCGIATEDWRGTASQRKTTVFVPDLRILSITLQSNDRRLMVVLDRLNALEASTSGF